MPIWLIYVTFSNSLVKPDNGNRISVPTRGCVKYIRLLYAVFISSNIYFNEFHYSLYYGSMHNTYVCLCSNVHSFSWKCEMMKISQDSFSKHIYAK